ncbi:MAG: hypothetical protein JSS34_06870 [Proteobacteria bacterium]|nr:hypothetical protein [Pseudomonadota bacterium]
MSKKYVVCLISFLSLNASLSVSLIAALPAEVEKVKDIHFRENMHKDSEFDNLYKDITASGEDLDVIIDKINHGDYGKVMLLTNCGRHLAGGNPETRGKYIAEAKDAKGYPVFGDILSAANAPYNQDHFVNGISMDKVSGQRAYLIRSRSVGEQGLILAKTYAQPLRDEEIVSNADTVVGSMW